VTACLLTPEQLPPILFRIANWCHTDGTEVLFTTHLHIFNVGGEQFWGRAVRASCDSI